MRSSYSLVSDISLTDYGQRRVRIPATAPLTPHKLNDDFLELNFRHSKVVSEKVQRTLIKRKKLKNLNSGYPFAAEIVGLPNFLYFLGSIMFALLQWLAWHFATFMMINPGLFAVIPICLRKGRASITFLFISISCTNSALPVTRTMSPILLLGRGSRLPLWGHFKLLVDVFAGVDAVVEAGFVGGEKSQARTSAGRRLR